MRQPSFRSFNPESITTGSIATTFIAFIAIRLVIESWISSFAQQTLYFYFYEALHTTTFFALLFGICVLLTRFITGITLRKSVTIYLFGFVLIIFPPIIDWIISLNFYNNTPFMSYYLFDSPEGLIKSYISFFGDRPHDGITYGTRIMIACALFFMTALTYLTTRRLGKSLAMLVVAYTIFFLLSAMPSFVTFLFAEASTSVTRSYVAGFIASPTTIYGNQIAGPINAINVKMSLIYMVILAFAALIFTYKKYRQTTRSLIINIRPVQTLYHIGLFFLGSGIAIIFNDAIILWSFFSVMGIIVLCMGIISAWYATVIFNDIIDQRIDKISNAQRPLIQKTITVEKYRQIGVVMTILSIVLVAMVSMHASLLLLGYHAISYLYNTPPLRLKRFPLIATLLAACASFLIVAMGYITLSSQHSLAGLPPQIAALLLIAYTISLPIKDIKDIHGDKKDHVYTIPVLLGEKMGRIFIGCGVFISFILSVFTLNNINLFFPALIAGSLTFWILVAQKNKRFFFSPQMSIGLVFAIVFVYGIILTISLLF